MGFLGLWLLTVGLADLVRWRPVAARRRLLLAAAAPLPVAVTVLACADASLVATLGWTVVLGALTGAWLLTSDLALGKGRHGPLPLAVLAAGALALLAISAVTPVFGGPLLRWYDQLDVEAASRHEFASFALAVGTLAFLQVTGNVVVRLVLQCAGSQPPADATTLRGGRVLGPLERTFLFALALSGDLTAAAVIVAAKGILRFPEIQRSRSGGVDALTEYFLIGSLTSWLLALLFVPLL